MREEDLIAAFKSINIDLETSILEKFKTYINEILLMNSRFNLVSKKDANFDAIFKRHILDSLTALNFIKLKNPSEVFDIGSGAGFPGVPLAILDINRKYFLVERSFKRAVFLKNIKSILSLENIEIFQRELESFQDNSMEFIVTRAFQDFSISFKNLYLKLKEGGILLAYKGSGEKFREEREKVKSLFKKQEIFNFEQSNKNLLILYK